MFAYLHLSVILLIRIVSVTNGFKDMLIEYADSIEPKYHSASFEQVAVDTHVPILNISTSAPRSLGRLTNVAIQGSFSTENRDFVLISERLIRSLHGKCQLSCHFSDVTGSDFSNRKSTFVGIPTIFRWYVFQ